jgi:F0F1-type ATP synthase assembly protein I
MKRFLPSLLPFLLPLTAFAINSGATNTPIDGLITMYVGFLNGPLTFLIISTLIIVLAYKWWHEHHIAAWFVKFIGICVLLAGGMGLVVRTFGGNLVTSVLL